jgi:hypothetical protein
MSQLLANNAGEEFIYGSNMLITPVIIELMKARAIDSVGCSYWIIDAKKFEQTKINTKFINIVDGIVMSRIRG